MRRAMYLAARQHRVCEGQVGRHPQVGTSSASGGGWHQVPCLDELALDARGENAKSTRLARAEERVLPRVDRRHPIRLQPNLALTRGSFRDFYLLPGASVYRGSRCLRSLALDCVAFLARDGC